MQIVIGYLLLYGIILLQKYSNATQPTAMYNTVQYIRNVHKARSISFHLDRMRCLTVKSHENDLVGVVRSRTSKGKHRTLLLNT